MKKIFIIHPILFAIFPVLSLYEHNKDLAQISCIIRPLTIAVILASLIFLIIKKIVKNNNKTALMTSLFLGLFFSFGHFASLFLPHIKIGRFIISNLDCYIPLLIWLVLFTSLGALIINSRKSFNKLTKYLNIVSIVLIIIPLTNIGVYEYKTRNTNETVKTANFDYTAAKNAEYLPDIYYIIFDGHARTDILKKIYNYDNSGFIDYLTNKGFYVASQSHSNYPQTYLSMVSSLNFEYINYLSEIMGKESDNRGPLRQMLKNNNVYKFLKNNDYVFVALPFTWTGTYQNVNADIYIKPQTIGLNEFENILINTTPLRVFWDKKIKMSSLGKRILFSFDHIPDIAEIKAPTFTYVHILSPHPPFIFDENGNPINPEGSASGLDGDHYFEENPGKEKYKKKYVNQLKFIDRKIMEMVNKILEKSDRQPIIILQADHGPGSSVEWEKPDKTNMKERMSILNAYYVSEKTKKLLYNSITPVNTFRVIFNSVFGANFELLEDKSYFATWKHPYEFINVGERIK